jgi:hypothetical protein
MLVKKCKNQTFITAVNFSAVITVPGENFAHKNRPRIQSCELRHNESSIVPFEKKKYFILL